MEMTDAPPTPSLAESFADLIETLLKLLFRFGAPTGEGAEFCRRLHWRLRRLGNRFASLVARVQAGTLGPPRVRVRPASAGAEAAEGTPHPGPLPQGEREKARAADPFPRTFAWLYRLLLAHSPPFTGRLEHLVWNEPAMAELYRAAPQAGRILRPFCHMLGVKLPDYLKLPQRVRRKKATSPRLPPHPLAARFPDTPAARSAARALARMQAGLPVDVRRLSSVAFGYFVHPPRDANCPPPEIGYGRGRWRPPKDYKPPEDRD